MNLPDFIQTNVDLSTRNTLALPGRAALFAEISTVDQLKALAGLAPRRFVLGGGSNIVLTGDFDGLVLHVALKGQRLLREEADAWIVEAGAGENWHDFVQWTLAQGWPGLENLSLIPGTVGAAPIQNIGAYGLELADRFESLEVFDLVTGELQNLGRNACCFSYRDSVFKQEGWHLDGRKLVTRVVFRLPKRWQPITSYTDLAVELEARKIATPNAQQIADAVVTIRQRKLPDPAQIPNAGSFFHNPVVDAATTDRLLTAFPGLPRFPQPNGHVKLAAGWLIEQSGWKGRNLGAAGMYEKQALVLVNRGGATGAEVKALMQAVQRDVRIKFGVELTPEPVFL